MVVALYAPIHNEVETDALLVAAFAGERQICYPRVDGESLVFIVITSPDDLVGGAFGILEPTGDKIVAPGDIDLAVVPGVGFDRSGYRLGYGGGYYDRAISAGRPNLLAGLAFDFQLVEKLPAEDHDICLDLAVTNTEMLAFN
jgi:5-formyltetrahydrofolate cyclo-ligase